MRNLPSSPRALGLAAVAAAPEARGKTVQAVIAAQPSATSDAGGNGSLFLPDVVTGLVFGGA